jgi:hypothetical protein
MSQGKYNSSSEEVHNAWKDIYGRNNYYYLNWLDKASDHKMASDIIFKECIDAIIFMTQTVKADDHELEKAYLEKHGLLSIWMMLMGYSLECLLKGLNFSVCSDNICDGVLRSWHSSGHDLIKLVKLYNDSCNENDSIVANDDMLNFLERLSVYTAWAGKYPLPKKYKDLIPIKYSTGGSAPKGLIKFGEDVNGKIKWMNFGQ